MRRLAETEGWTLVELLIAATLMLLVMGATLAMLDGNVRANRVNQLATQDTETARNAMDLLTRDSRNATAYQTTANATASSVLRAAPQDFVFKAVDANGAASAANTYGVQTIRYCYSAATAELLRQVKADAVVPAASCPDPSFTTTARVAGVVNGARAVFSYDSATTAVTSVGVDLFVDSTPNGRPAATALHSGIFLRNANRPPVASFTAVPTANLHVQLNGSASSDADGGALAYTWKVDGTTIWQTGALVDYVAASAGNHQVTLTVTDRGGLTDTATQTVTAQP